jgi:hypothetical protein
MIRKIKRKIGGLSLFNIIVFIYLFVLIYFLFINTDLKLKRDLNHSSSNLEETKKGKNSESM